ncbi:Telomeric repeat-binding factor 2 [Paenibacillus konkukensis]|uniref:Telomeric repeat-binding factor 2 n=1 Tax=Paenibacillus konkukensis TaxID=2020716 RepID=A0ABY4S0W5_9BACL|nr:hypothetical protein [Paenibacillus konkukensis]UQZ87127.1 Telomeric repeat-binding factor 2 [Paenibacillus konkukensis]
MKWKKTVTSVVITTSLITTTGYAVLAADPVQTSVQPASAAVSYPLTDTLQVEIKSVLNERVAEGTRIGVVVRMKNSGAGITRVPEYELRVKTSDGIEYTLQPSASNPKAIQPLANTELSYMAVIDRTDNVALSEVNWTDVDYYVYPKKETLIVAVPVSGQSWKGSDMAITDPTAVKKWGETFTIPSLISPLEYTPVNIEKELSDKGTVQVVQLLVTNPTDQRETLPDFTLDGKSETQVYAGKLVENGGLILEAKEQKYIHFAIPTDNDTVLSSLNVLTPEKFAEGGAAAAAATVNYNVGRLNVLLPAAQASQSYPVYELKSPMKFDSLSDLIHPNMQVSMVEFHMNDNEEEGSKNVTAKFKLSNKSDMPIAVPAFQTDLVSADGYTYSGSRQNITTPTVLPNSSLVVSYSFTLPVSETGSGLALKIQDTQKAAPYKTTIAGYKVALQESEPGEQFDLYPFNVKVSYWTISPLYNRTGNNTYSYKARFDLEITRDEQVQIDQSFSKLQFELYDSLGRLIGTTSGKFIGNGRLVTGENNMYFDATTEQLDRPLTIKAFEVFTTQAGDSKRLLGVFKQ